MAQQRILLAYSGGPRSSAAISWLAETHRADVVALTLDIGQGGDLEGARDRALTLGAIRAHVLDVRDEFARRFLVPALKADVLYVDRRSRANVLSRPLIARKLVEIAEIEQTATVAHASAARNPQIGVALRALSPTIDIVAVDPRLTLPASDGRDAGRTLRSPASHPNAAAALGTPASHPNAAAALGTPADCPDEPAWVDIRFSRGAPDAINGIAMPLLDLVGSLDILAGAHGVGRSDRLETPSAIVLHAAHQDLQSLAIVGEADAFSRDVSRQYSDIVEHGSWFTPLRESLEAHVDKMQKDVNGLVRVKLFKGNCAIVSHQLADPPDAPVVAAVRKLTFTATAKA